MCLFSTKDLLCFVSCFPETNSVMEWRQNTNMLLLLLIISHNLPSPIYLMCLNSGGETGAPGRNSCRYREKPYTERTFLLWGNSTGNCTTVPQKKEHFLRDVWWNAAQQRLHIYNRNVWSENVALSTAGKWRTSKSTNHNGCWKVNIYSNCFILFIHVFRETAEKLRLFLMRP